MYLTCERCSNGFENATFRGYCDGCVSFFLSVRDRVACAQNPAPNVMADGKFADAKRECPQSFFDHTTRHQVCGLCGSDDLEPGYGLGSGYGMGSYTWCDGCGRFLDFSEDTGE